MADVELTQRPAAHRPVCPLKVNAVLRETTSSAETLLKSVMMSSVIPSLKYLLFSGRRSCSQTAGRRWRTVLVSARLLSKSALTSADGVSSCACGTFVGGSELPASPVIEIEHVDALAVLHFHLAQIMQRWPPSSVLLKIFSDSLRKQDMTGVATIHHSLGEINPNPGSVDPIIYVGHRAHQPRAHPCAPVAANSLTPG